MGKVGWTADTVTLVGEKGMYRMRMLRGKETEKGLKG